MVDDLFLIKCTTIYILSRLTAPRTTVPTLDRITTHVRPVLLVILELHVMNVPRVTRTMVPIHPHASWISVRLMRLITVL